MVRGQNAISIHALLAESDALGAVTSPAVIRFLSTLSLRRATHEALHGGWLLPISIHALLAESDAIKSSVAAVFPISIHALLAESDLPYHC